MTDGIEVRYEGLGRVTNWLRNLGGLIQRDTDKETEMWGEETERVLKSKPYPPQRSGSRHQRTFELRNRWKLEKKQQGAFAITNKARDRRGRFYARYPVGDGEGKGQAWMHRDRWWLFMNVIRERLPKLTGRIVSAIRRRAS